MRITTIAAADLDLAALKARYKLTDAKLDVRVVNGAISVEIPNAVRVEGVLTVADEPVVLDKPAPGPVYDPKADAVLLAERIAGAPADPKLIAALLRLTGNL